jgi:spore germination protein YaaH
MRRLRWVVPLVVLLSLLVSSVAFAAPAQGWGGGGYWYTVRWGDSLSSIGRAAGVSPWTIAQANGLGNPNYIRAGQQLWIPAGGPPPHQNPGPGCGYWRPVYFGDTLYSIAWSTGVSSYAIAAANGLYNSNVIYAGSSLWIPCGGHPHW